MNRARIAGVGILYFVVVANSSLATDYFVTFKKTMDNSLIVSIDDSAYKSMVPWKTYYREIVKNGKVVKEGSLMTNGSSYRITAIHIRNRGGTFDVPADADGGMFREVWLKKDRTEAIFNGGDIPNTGSGRRLWMKVSPKSPSSEDQLDGEFSDSDIVPPKKSAWTRVVPAGDKASRWSRMAACMPLDSKGVRVYADTADGKRMLLICDDDVLWYDDEKRQLRTVLLPPVPVGVNRITNEKRNAKEVFILWKDDVEVHVVEVSAPVLAGVLGSTDAE